MKGRRLNQMMCTISPSFIKMMVDKGVGIKVYNFIKYNTLKNDFAGNSLIFNEVKCYLDKGKYSRYIKVSNS